MTPARKLAVTLAAGQGVFYLLTGVWPLLSIESFQRVTGPKVDLWLVQTVGVLVAVIGAVLLLAAARRRVSLEAAVLAAGSAAALAVVDITFVVRGRISAIYLADAAVEILLVALWLAAAWLHVTRAASGGPRRHEDTKQKRESKIKTN